MPGLLPIYLLEWNTSLPNSEQLCDFLMCGGEYFWDHQTPDPRWLISYQCDLQANLKIPTVCAVDRELARVVGIAGFAIRGDLIHNELEPFWLVRNGYREYGLGSTLYKAAESRVPSRFKTLIARIELVNTPSLKFAAKQGYNPLIRSGDYQLVSKYL